MKYQQIIIVSAFYLTSGMAYAQTSIKNDEPAGQDQQYWKEIPKDLPPKRDLALVSKDTIPTRLRRTLNGSELYEGWENLPIYIDRNTSLYMLYLKKDRTISIYGFNENGKPITYDAYTKPKKKK